MIAGWNGRAPASTSGGDGYRCTVSDGRDDSALKDVTLIVTADNKVGLYDNQGKEMK